MFSNWETTKLKKGAFVYLMVGSLATCGCASRGGIMGVDCCADIPAGAIPEPAGAKVCNWESAQVTAAIADQTVFYKSDFIGTSENLSPGAMERMARNASSGLATMQPVYVEPSGDAELDAERVVSVNMKLASLGVDMPTAEVATPAALGLRGPFAEQAAGGFAGNRGSSTGTGAPVSRASGLGSQGSFGGNLSGGIF